MKTRYNSTLSLTLGIALFTVGLYLVQQADAGAFFATGEMMTPRYGQTATLLTNGTVLIAGGRDNSTFQETSGAELYDPATGHWTATGSMSTPRLNHSATLLPDGKVLVAGGTGTNFATLINAELYDPATGDWTPTGPLNVARRSHTASLLPDGKVLVAGGTYDSSGRCELYDPASGDWTLTGTMMTNREDHTATVLTNGMVLVAGGDVVGAFDLERTATAELYNPTTGAWIATGSMTTNRAKHADCLLKNGKVLVEGNVKPGGTSVDASAELYDPVSGVWSATGSMLFAFDEKPPATLLPDGDVLVADGGVADGGVAEIYNPDLGQWLVAGSTLGEALSGNTVTLLANGKVLLAGNLSSSIPALGYYPLSAQLYDPNTAWKATGSLNIPRESGFTLTLLTNGDVLVAGGKGFNGVEASAEVYHSATGEWIRTGDMTQPREFQTATLLNSGKVLVAGGHNENGGINGGVLSMAELYDPVTGTWAETGEMNFSRQKHQATLLKNGTVLVTGRDVYNHDSAELYDPVAGTWSVTDSTKSLTVVATLLPDGRALAIDSNGGAEMYDPDAAQWTAVSPRDAQGTGMNAVLLSDNRVFVAGGFGPATAEIYDPSSDTWTATASTANVQPTITTLLSDGRVLMEGRLTTESQNIHTAPAVIYDPMNDTWTSTFGPMTSVRQSPQAVRLLNGKVLVAGDLTAELFDPGVGTSIPPSIVLVPSPTLGGGAFEFNFTAAAGQSFTVWSTTSVAEPFSNWTSLGAVMEVLPGNYQFTDSQVPNHPFRFYRVSSP